MKEAENGVSRQSFRKPGASSAPDFFRAPHSPVYGGTVLLHYTEQARRAGSMSDSIIQEQVAYEGARMQLLEDADAEQRFP